MHSMYTHDVLVCTLNLMWLTRGRRHSARVIGENAGVCAMHGCHYTAYVATTTVRNDMLGHEGLNTIRNVAVRSLPERHGRALRDFLRRVGRLFLAAGMAACWSLIVKRIRTELQQVAGWSSDVASTGTMVVVIVATAAQLLGGQISLLAYHSLHSG